jgi:hypothetical protein
MKYKNIDGVKFNPGKIGRSTQERIIVLRTPVKKVSMNEFHFRPSAPTEQKPLPKKTLQSVKVPAKMPTRVPKVSSQQITKKSFFNQRAYQRVIIPIIIFVALAAFTGGMGFALTTPKSVAEEQLPLPSTPPDIAGNLGNAPAPTTALSNDAIFNTPLELLQSYIKNSSDANALAERKAALKKFLVERQSPLANNADLIAEQPHWQLILAISFAESTLGKKCFEFNCSGIGGSNLRIYKSFTNWILDFNRLLDNHYNSWTLDQMCGVYVQPCTQNWLNATKQILDELKSENIN